MLLSKPLTKRRFVPQPRQKKAALQQSVSPSAKGQHFLFSYFYFYGSGNYA